MSDDVRVKLIDNSKANSEGFFYPIYHAYASAHISLSVLSVALSLSFFKLFL
jgi:hypothetical protein